MDHHYISTKAAYVRPRHYKERLLLEMEAGVTSRFAPLLDLCTRQGEPNAMVGCGLGSVYDHVCWTALSGGRADVVSAAMPWFEAA